MSKQVNFSHISFYKIQFDLLHSISMKTIDPIALETTSSKMSALQEKIFSTLDNASVSVSKYFKWTSNTPDTTVDVDTIKTEVQKKLDEILQHSFKIASQTPITNQVVHIPPVKTTPSLMTLPQEIIPSQDASTKPLIQATDFAVGFGNLGANCWANSLLSMILSMPNFKRAYEAVANYYVQLARNPQDVVHGNAMINGLSAYNTALIQKKPVPSSVSQNIRLAFHHFFGHKNLLSFHEIFSQQCYQQEDAWEGMQVLMGRYEQILREQTQSNSFPSPYSILETKRHYRPIGNPRPADPGKLARNDYSELRNDNVSSLTNNDYQIILDLQNKGHLSFSALLNEYFRNTHLQGHDNGTYLRPDKTIQQFELIGEGRQFVQVPEELLLTIKRFGSTMGGASYKIASPLAIDQILILPVDGTRENTPIAYELDTFNVHKGDFGGGHYIAYRKINGQWIEANDGTVRLVSEQEIDQILHGQKGPTFTSYMHHYIRIETSRQQQVIASAHAVKTHSSKTPEALAQEIATCEQNIQQLETFSVLLQSNSDPSSYRVALQALETNAIQALITLRHALWLNDKTPDVHDYGTVTLNANPERLRDITTPWLISASGNNLVEQLLLIQRHRLEIATEKLNGELLQPLLEKIRTPSVSDDELAIAFKALPQKLQNSLCGLVYDSHLKKFGREHVQKEEFQNNYGYIILEKDGIRKVLTGATESILNLWGKNILEQLISEHRIKAEKLQCAYEKDLLQALHDLSLRSINEITNEQLFKAFELMDLSIEMKEKLYWHIWYSYHTPEIYNFGATTFKNDPRSLSSIRDPNLTRPPLSPTGSNILFQMIKLLERESR